jgi:transcriptional regulator with XRE-family HTH domain
MPDALPTATNRRIGRRLRLARERAGLRLDQLATLVGVTRRTVDRWESGAYPPRLEWLARIARALEVDWRDLLPHQDSDAEHEEALRWHRLGAAVGKPATDRDAVCAEVLGRMATLGQQREEAQNQLEEARP